MIEGGKKIEGRSCESRRVVLGARQKARSEGFRLDIFDKKSEENERRSCERKKDREEDI